MIPIRMIAGVGRGASRRVASGMTAGGAMATGRGFRGAWSPGGQGGRPAGQQVWAGGNARGRESSFGMGYGGAVGVVGGAVLGGAASYWSGGSFGQGAAAGAATGGLMARSMGKQHLSKLGRYVGREFGKNATMSRFSSGMVRTGGFLENKSMRRVMFGAGAMLGGSMFGGERSHSRGFNSQRGNRFGR